MLVRYFGAAQAAAGVPEERLELDGVALEEVLGKIRALHPDGQPSMARVLDRSSFLLNEVALRDRSGPIRHSDVLDILPPFAGG
ncbi:MoaD/ThiS family protein [Arthrobacter tumbae]|uniref:MoaD/ThiS family protein n=1 Tax=Arthrobacter tumbae TaxID=163874 RepID=UPI00195C49B1|nr:MoaD/ThiS family protein [Arthrobacter tumbae]MBM7782734.1 molybdopterin converting factor small subunit [Arthrobacter tumbae]